MRKKLENLNMNMRKKNMNMRKKLENSNILSEKFTKIN